MAEVYGFFNAQGGEGNYDRTYSAEDFSEYFARFIPNGVFVGEQNELEVVAKSGRTVTVKTGWASIDGHYYHLTADKDITLALNSGASERIDSICCTLDVSQRKIEVGVRQETTTPRDDGSYHDLILATISMPSNQSSISASNITDRRDDESFCGMIDPLGKISGYVTKTDITTTYTTNSDTKVMSGSAGVKLRNYLEGQLNLLKNDTNTKFDEKVLMYRGNISNVSNLDSTLTPGIYGIPGLTISEVYDTVIWGVMVVMEREASNGPWLQVILGEKVLIWRSRAGSPVMWSEWNKAATSSDIDSLSSDIDSLKGEFHQTIDTQVTGTSNWVVINKNGYYSTQASAVRDGADYYVEGINKQSAGDSYALVFNKSVNRNKIMVRLDWRQKP